MNWVETVHWMAVGWVVWDVVSGLWAAFSDDTQWRSEDRGDADE